MTHPAEYVAKSPSAFMTMQDVLVGQESEVPAPGYWVAEGMTCRGAAHDEPSHSVTEPPESAAMQNVVVGQEMASRLPPGSMVSTGDQVPDPFR